MKHILFLTSFLFVGLSVWAQSKLTPEQIKKGHYQEINFGIGADTIKLDSYPMYPWGLNGMHQQLSENLKYPISARMASIEGYARVSFIVDTLGKIKKVEIIETNYEEFGIETERAFKFLKKWVPAYLKGSPVSVKYTMTIPFKLN